jgi:hypothetical protein
MFTDMLKIFYFVFLEIVVNFRAYTVPSVTIFIFYTNSVSNAWEFMLRRGKNEGYILLIRVLKYFT